MENNTIDKIREFNRFYTKIIGLLNDHILDSEYSLSEVRVMYEIHYGSNITARQIKEILQIDEGYLSRVITKLEKQKIIQKTKLSTDNRITVLTLTENGKTIFLTLNKKSSESISHVFGHLTQEEQKELIRNFERITLLIHQKKR